MNNIGIKPTIAILSCSAGTLYGGTETYVINEAAFLSKDYNVKLITGGCNFTNDFSVLVEPECIPCLSLPFISRKSFMTPLLLKTGIYRGVNQYDLEAVSMIPSIQRIKEYVENADLIEVNYPIEGLIFPLLNKGIKKVIHFHSPWLTTIYKIFHRKIENCTDLFITCSEWSKKELETNYNIKGVEVIHNGINTEFFNPRINTKIELNCSYDEDLIKVGTVSRLSKIKGTDVLLDVAREMKGQAEFFIVGQADASFLEELKQYREVSNIHFLDTIPNKIIPAFYNFIDCFVLPSRLEPFGIVILEAMSCEKSVIATDAGGVPEIISNERDGILIPPGDRGSLKEAIELLIKNKNLRDEIGKGAREKVVNKFSLEKTYEDLGFLYNNLLK